MLTHRRLGVYRVADTEFYDRATALAYASLHNVEPYWDFNEDVFSNVDWSTPIETELLELYRQRAQQLRDKYDFVSLFFSGGVDSTMVLHAFIDNNIFLDEIVMYRPSCLVSKANKQDRSCGNIFSEIEFAAIPHLNKHLHTSKTKVRFLNLDKSVEKLLANEKLMEQYSFLRFTNPHYLSRLSLCTQDLVWSALYLADKKVCHLQGTDKPVVSFKNGEYFFQFNDNTFMTSLQTTFNSPEAEMITKNQNHEFFFWTPDKPQIVIKQAQIVKNLAINNGLLRIMISGKYNVNESSMTPILKYIYPPHVVAIRDLFATQKVNSLATAANNQWFYDYMPSNTKGAFQDMLRTMKTKINRNFMDAHSSALTLFRSPLYKI